MSSVRLFRIHLPVSLLILLGVEALILGGAFAAGAVWPAGEGRLTAPVVPVTTLFVVVSVLAMAAMGLFQIRLRASASDVIARMVVVFLLSGGVVAAVLYVVPEFNIGRGRFVLAGAVASLVVMAVHTGFIALADVDRWKRRVLVLGAGEKARELTKLRRRSDRRTFSVVGYLPSVGEQVRVASEPVLNPDRTLSDLVQSLHIDEVVVAVTDYRQDFPLRELLDCRLSGTPVTDVANFLEREACKIDTAVTTPSWLVFADGYVDSPRRRFEKRAFDLVVGTLLLLAALPVMALTAVAIKIEDGMRAPVLYRQQRTGRNGVVFTVRKFRSMRIDAEADGKARWAQRDDARITRVGRAIRKWRIDELPQLLNVMEGTMSVVGPRPERPEFVEQLTRDIPYYAHRHRTKPGITGWAQLSYPYGASLHDAQEKLQYDLYYVKNQSLLLDLIIVLRTVEVVLFGKGAR